MHYVDGGAWRLAAADDADSAGGEGFSYTSAAGIPQTANFTPAVALQYGGIEVGYRGLRQRRSTAGSTNTAATDNGGMIDYGGSGGGDTLTLDADIPAEGVIIITNTNSVSALTIACSGTLTWLSGAGAVTGSRTMAKGSIATAYHSGSGNYLIWGNGLS
jgi:hypothetical protein